MFALLLCDSTWLFLRRNEEVARVWLVPKDIRAGGPGRTSLGLILKTGQLSSGQGRAQLAESPPPLFPASPLPLPFLTRSQPRVVAGPVQMSMSLVGECREKGEPPFRFPKHLKPRQGVEEARAVLCQARFPLIFIPKCILKEMKSTCFWSFILKSSKYCLLGALCVRKPIEPFSQKCSLPPGKINRKW